MVLRRDGSISVDSPNLTITADWTLQQFRSSELFKLSAPLNQNPPWSRYACKPLQLAGEQFAVDICFSAGALYSIGLAVMRPEYAESWSDWSEEKERGLKFHNALLKKALGRGSGHYRFA
jgi:hypothetical protein